MPMELDSITTFFIVLLIIIIIFFIISVVKESLTFTTYKEFSAKKHANDIIEMISDALEMWNNENKKKLSLEEYKRSNDNPLFWAWISDNDMQRFMYVLDGSPDDQVKYYRLVFESGEVLGCFYLEKYSSEITIVSNPCDKNEMTFFKTSIEKLIQYIEKAEDSKKYV